MSKKVGGFIGLIIFVVVYFPVVSFAQEEGKFSIGAILGGPTGISAKFWISERNAIDGAASWTSNGSSHFHFDYLWHDFNRFKSEKDSPPLYYKGSLPFYYGVGGRFEFDKETEFGIRGVIGVAYLFAEAPFEAFFEIAPFLRLTPGTDAGLDAAVGIRYLFK